MAICLKHAKKVDCDQCGAEAERTGIVEWLREQSASLGYGYARVSDSMRATMMRLDDYAKRIENGEHLKRPGSGEEG